MGWVVFLRAANVGSNNRFRPASLAEDLAEFQMVNVGAVGTFVVCKNVTEQKLRAAIARKLPFKCEIMICPARTIVDLARENSLARLVTKDVEGYLTMLATVPEKQVSLPVFAPDEKNWQVKIVRMEGRAALSLRRKVPGGRSYPNELVEKKFGVAGTTRNWNTVEKILGLLQSTDRG